MLIPAARPAAAGTSRAAPLTVARQRAFRGLGHLLLERQLGRALLPLAFAHAGAGPPSGAVRPPKKIVLDDED